MARELKFFAALILAMAFSGAGTANADVLQEREVEPIVLTGSLPGLVGVPPDEVVAFAWFEGWGQIKDGWEPVTLQVDERKRSESGRLVYADPNAGSGADGNSMLDLDDEISMMAIEAGLPAGDRPDPKYVEPATRTAVRVSDPLKQGDQAWIYLFRSLDGLAPDGGNDLVTYERDFDPLLDYSFPEASTVVTGRYDIGIRGRWMTNRLSIAAGEVPDQDILDGDKLNVGPGVCETSELALSRGEGYFLADIDGPVRAIRSVTGSRQGISFSRESVFYEGLLETRTTLDGLPAGSNVISALDLSRQATGMTWRNEKNPEGVTVDGKPDQVAGAAARWEQVSGNPGSVTSVTRVATEGVSKSTFYEDRAEPPGDSPMNCSGDGASLGAAGARFKSRDGGELEFSKRSWFDSPDVGAETGKLRSLQVDQPLGATIDATEPAILVARARPSRVVLRPGQRRSIRVVVRNHGAKRARRLKICAGTGRWASARCRFVARLNRGGKLVRRITIRSSRKAGKGSRILPIRVAASRARSYGDRVKVSVRSG